MIHGRRHGAVELGDKLISQSDSLLLVVGVRCREVGRRELLTFNGGEVIREAFA